MNKRILRKLCYVCLILSTLNLQLTHLQANDSSKNDCINEEIQMFDEYYEHPENYVFYNKEGKTINDTLDNRKNEYMTNKIRVASEFMDQVGYVEELQIMSGRTSVPKSIKNIKVYYTKSDYVICNLSVTLTTNKGNIIKSTEKFDLDRKSTSTYSITKTSKNIGNTGKVMDYTITHAIRKVKKSYTIITKHKIRI